jgi:hypothetical protein
VIYPEAEQFTAAMDERLRRSEAEHGRAWKTMSVEQLMSLANQNFDEFDIALRYGNDIEAKAADVANILWMVVDQARHGSVVIPGV